MHPAPGVTAESVGADHEARGSSGLVPPDRVSARAWQAAQSVFLVDVPKEHTGDEPTTVTLTGTGNDVASAGHLVITGRRTSPGSPSCCASRARPPWPRTSRSSSATAPS